MEMESTKQVKVLEVCQVTPSTDSPESAIELSLPLTFLDILLLKCPPVERIFFYKLTSAESKPNFFDSVILPKLKHTLSRTLLHFLPLAGNLTWPPQATKPIILYTPNDGISLTFAESSAHFNHLSGNEVRESAESHPYIPKLLVTDSKASIVALQITLFPDQGFCIGISSHHAIIDGKCSTMFIKAWAYICKFSDTLLPPELSPSFDRNQIVMQDPDGLDMVYLSNWSLMDPINPRSLKLLQCITAVSNSSMRMTVEFSREDIERLRERAISKLDPSQAGSIHLSTFVLVCAYLLGCIVKAKGAENNTKVVFILPADCRSRLGTPIPDNYFGNCVSTYALNTEAEALMEEENNGFVFAAQRLSELIKSIEKGAVALDRAKKEMSELGETMRPGAVTIGVAGSTRLGVYGTDFGWGNPRKVEITSTDRTGAISMAESKDGSGGVEVGIVLEKHEMVIFNPLFVGGLKNP